MHGVQMYAITGTSVETVNGYEVMRQLPIFYLHPNVQGIVTADHAERIARRMFEDVGREGCTYHLYALLVDINTWDIAESHPGAFCPWPKAQDVGRSGPYTT